MTNRELQAVSLCYSCVAAGNFTVLQLRGLTDVHEHVIHVADGER